MKTAVRRFGLLVTIACAAASSSVLAADRGDQPFDDPHLREYPFNADQVYVVQSRVDKFTDFQVPDNERIMELDLSDKRSSQWRFVVSYDQRHALIKPVVESADNVALILTDKRVYHITFLPAIKKGTWDQRVTWAASADAPAWTAPDSVRRAVAAGVQPPAPRATDALATINVNYTVSGDGAIRPSAVYDDGHLTKIVFPASLQTLPAVLVTSADGKLDKPRWTISTDPSGARSLVVQQLFTKATLVLGSAKAEIVNHAFPASGSGMQAR
ncbi:TrbG/VirB9 family P-type conjugative transfer protein [Burkholderia gladioli]|uniref:TrbG/VirB9 family P-type conjugative transfer protein n=1 Tax=Burkholderia gladioli TaxID=28095 RepID=UPI00164168A5|nr:TrbG/VirB9 family P-type conjugative transfer protein [Burkholderia gladioli]